MMASRLIDRLLEAVKETEDQVQANRDMIYWLAETEELIAQGKGNDIDVNRGWELLALGMGVE